MERGYLKTKVLESISRGEPVSGGLIASKLGVSRTAVWKAVNALRAEGYFISGKNGGYVLGPENSRICGEQFAALTEGAKVIFKEKTVSTNEDIKKIAEAGGKEFTVLIARSQSGGKGRLGRSFSSPEGGLYFSLLLRPDFSPEDCLKITTAAAVAIRAAIEKVSSKPAKIKWVNDIFVGDKKVCGILTEGAFDAENGKLKYAVLGIGVNVAAPKGGFSAKLTDKAASLFEGGKVPSLAYCALLNEFLGEFKKYYTEAEKMPHLEEYRKYSYLDGKTVTYIKDGKTHTAKVLGIGKDAELIVKERHRKERLKNGEVDIKL